MKRNLSYLAFLPFILALLWAAKVYGKKLFDNSESQQLYYSASENQQHNLENSNVHQIQVALLLDVSGSMSGLIDQAKAKLWQVVNDLSDARKGGENPNLEIALYIYGGDNLEVQKGYVKQLAPLTTDLDLISEQLFSLSTNGGQEYCGQVIQAAQLELAWSKKSDDLRIVFIAGNEPFNQGNIQYQQVCKMAKENDILVNTIFCGVYLEGINSFWKHGADITNGAYMNIDHNIKSVHVATPYDQELSKLNVELNTTYYGYTAKGSQMIERQIKQDQNAASFGEANIAKRAISKSKGAYKNSSWDLLDAIKEKKVKVEELDKSHLSNEFKNMETEELKKTIEELSAKRNSIQQKIVELDKKRKSYISGLKKEKAQGQTLDAAISKAIREQAKAKKYTFEN